MLMVLSGDSLQVLIECEAGNNLTFSLDFHRDFFIYLCYDYIVVGCENLS